MRRHIYLLATLAVASLATANAQSTGGSQGASGQRTQTPTQSTQTPPRATTPSTQQATPPTNTTVTPPNTTAPPANTTVVPPNTTVVPPNTTPPANPPAATRNPNVQQDRVPPAARGVGTANRPNCSNLRGLEKSECERRDTSRDDLPAGVTSTQPKNPPQ